MGMRNLKKLIESHLMAVDFEDAVEEICKIPARQVVNALISFFYSKTEIIKWRAITALGAVVANQTQSDLEGARIVMRRFMWMLNDESGGIGWGAPEAMGEIMARNERLSNEYHRILISFINPEGNYLEYEPLQQGALWGIGRLAHQRPLLVKGHLDFLLPFFLSSDPMLRGLSAWIAGVFRDNIPGDIIAALENDSAKITLFVNGQLRTDTIAGILDL